LAPLLLLPALAGCMVGPGYHRAPVATPVAYKELAGWKPGHPLDAIDRGAWWSVYHDPLLDSLESRVAVSNQTLAEAYAAYRNAQAIVREARANLFPVLDATSSATRAAQGTAGRGISSGFSGANGGQGISTTSYTLEGSASWDLDVWGRVRRTVESDVAAAQASAADVASAQLSAQGALATDYFDLRASDALEKLLSDTVAGYQRTLQITQNQYDVGVAARSDVLTAQVQLESTQAQLINVGVARAQYEHAIAVLTGQPPAALSIPAGELAADVPIVPVSVPSALLERRPDVAAAERAMQQQNALIGAAIAGYYPDISLSALYGYVGNPLSSLISASNRVWSLGATGTETIFAGGARSAEVAAARATYDEAVATYRQTVLTAFQQVEDELAALRILEREAEAQAVAVRDARHAVDIALNEYRAGTQPYTTVVTAQDTALTDEQSALTVQQNRLVASVALIQALGGGWDSTRLPRADDLQRGIPLLPDALDPTSRPAGDPNRL
jgi:NodT family efflux transporter outer membrane factor (OMF) lipoprotein